jgi:mRNA-degrading endonuclease RelE of RelBE toxin-antitoxin system
MKIIQTDDFKKELAKLPLSVQKTYTEQEIRFLANHRDSRLHIKKLHGLDGVFSFRITREYRALFYFHDKEIIVFFAVGHRKDVYRDL